MAYPEGRMDVTTSRGKSQRSEGVYEEPMLNHKILFEAKGINTITRHINANHSIQTRIIDHKHKCYCYVDITRQFMSQQPE